MRTQTLMKTSLMQVNKQSPKFCATRDCKNLCCVSVMLLYKCHPIITNFKSRPAHAGFLSTDMKKKKLVVVFSKK